jgi:hypothetical protein
MAIDRGPWNALVDDDGSNLVGTVWNKDKIKTVILDPTDAAITAAVAPIGTMGTWTAVPFNAANFPSTPTITAGMVLMNDYTVIGKTFIWTIQVVNAPNTSIASITLIAPPAVSLRRGLAPLAYATDNNVWTAGFSTVVGFDRIGLYKNTFAAWAGPTVTFYLTATFSLN